MVETEPVGEEAESNTATRAQEGGAPEQGAQAAASCPRARAEIGALPAARLQAELVLLAHRLAVGTYELLLLVGELDARGTWSDSGALSCEMWLADVCDIELSTARRQVRVARAMRRHPVLDEAMACGDVSYSKARILAGQLTGDNADELVEIARITPSGRLGKAIAAWSERNEDPEVIRRRQHLLRSMGWGSAADGMVDFHARLTPEDAAAVCAVIDTTVARRASVPAGTTLRQQRADAFIAVCAGEGDIGGASAEIVVHVSADGNTLDDGTPLSDRAVTEMLPGSYVSLLLHDAERYPIDASPRRRFPTRRQRRVVEARQDECGEDGCHAHRFLEVDHREPYGAGGLTVLDNLQRLCGPHNRAKSRRDDVPDE